MSGGVDAEISRRGIATILLNRPDGSNALDQEMLRSLAKELAARADDAATRVIVLRGAGKHFCAGASLARRMQETQTPRISIANVLAALDTLPKPTVAVVQGAAIGGGAALAACCDVVLAAKTAFFSIPEVRLGMVPLGVAPFLVRAMGQRGFRRYGLSGERFGAAEALRLGLVHDVVDGAQLETKLDEIVDALLHGAPGALRELKTAMTNDSLPLTDRFEKGPAANHRQSAEALEGIASFKEKRKPSWYPQ